MSGYENAPQTEMLATHCAVCGRPLCDAKSVELGIGPVCREKYGFDMAACTEAEREQANKIVYKVALAVSNDSVDVDVLQEVAQLRKIGFMQLADIIEVRAAKIHVRVEEGRYLVHVPYDPGFNEASKVKGRAGFKVGKVFWWSFPKEQKARKVLWQALCERFGGQLAVGPQGPFKVQKAS